MRESLLSLGVVFHVMLWYAAPTAGQSAVAITDVNVVDVQAGRVLVGQTVVVEAGRVRSVGVAGIVATGMTQIDGTGKYLIPGLWDMHVHIRSRSAPDVLFPLFVANGVTGVRDMNSDCDDPSRGGLCIETLREWQTQVEEGRLLGPRIMALSSPPVNPPWDWDESEEQVREAVRRFGARGADLVKMYFRASPTVFGWVMDEAKKNALDVAGHIPLRLHSTEASRLGLRSLEHVRDFLFDCFPGAAEFRRTTLSQNPPTAVMRSMVDDHDISICRDVFQTYSRNRTWYVPTHVTRRMDAFADDSRFRADPRSRFVPTSVWESWQSDADRMIALDSTPEGRRVMRRFYEVGLEITGRAFAAGVPIVLGTDAGDTYVFPGSGVHDELGELVKAGLSPAQALAASTIRSAEFMGRADEFGTVEAGKFADMVLLNANPLQDIANTRNIQMVFVTGHVLYRTDLDRMLSDVETAVAR